ncbi:hypothetical protein NBRC116494_23780 [Aurantivibrio plasticivorans]
MSETIEIPNFFSVLENIKAIFSEELNTQQKNNYRCLTTWALKLPVLEQQLAGGTFTEELRSSLIKMLAPTQDALTDIHFSIKCKRDRIASLSEAINQFYLSFNKLPTARPISSIVQCWQDVHGQGSLPTFLPLPPPLKSNNNNNAQCSNDDLFTNDNDIPWTYNDTPAC